MKTLRTLLPCLLLAAATTRLPADPLPLDASANPRFIQTRARIDALFHFRNPAAPLPDARSNPFRLATVSAAPAAGNPAAPAPLPESDDALLQLGAASLKVGGLVVKDGQPQLIINGGTYKEGDVITTRVHGTPVYFRIAHIASTGVTIRLNDSELTISF